MGRDMTKFSLIDFEKFIVEDLELVDTNFERKNGRYVDQMTTCLHLLWDNCWDFGYEEGFENGRDYGEEKGFDHGVSAGRRESSDRNFFGSNYSG